MQGNSFRRTRNNIPVLSKNEIESIAEWNIRQFCPEALEKPMEIDAEKFAFSHLGLKQDFQYLSNNGACLGMLVFNDTSKVPVYIPEKNEADYIFAKARTMLIDNSLLAENQEGRYRFTVMHECAHDIFHKDYFEYDPNEIDNVDSTDSSLIKCRELSSNKSNPVEVWDDMDTMEWQANYFAAAFLMPKSMVLKLIESIPGKDSHFIETTYINNVAKTFNVSLEAAKYRLEDLGIIKDEGCLNTL
jgi:Zn-dependent peptidase ImmA (M78 family)